MNILKHEYDEKVILGMNFILLDEEMLKNLFLHFNYNETHY